MKFQLGQKVKYKKVVRRKTRFIEEKEFDENEIIEIDRIGMAELTKVRIGFIVGLRTITAKAEYTYETDGEGMNGETVYYKSKSKKVYKVTYDMAHTNFVLEEDLKEVIN